MIQRVHFLIYFIDYAITVVPFFLPFILFRPVLPSTIIPPPQFMSMGHTYKFGFSISYTILNLLLSILYLPLMLLIPCTFSSSNSPLTTLHVTSISVNLFLFLLFAQFASFFLFVCLFAFLGSVVDSCEFIVILLFIFLIIFLLLDNSL